MDAGSVALEPELGAVTRPAPGLARGPFEAPPWFFWGALAVGVLASLIYGGWRVQTARVRRGGAR